MDGRIVRCGIFSSCQPAATSGIVKALLATSSYRVKNVLAITRLHFFIQHNSFLSAENFESKQKRNKILAPEIITNGRHLETQEFYAYAQPALFFSLQQHILAFFLESMLS